MRLETLKRRPEFDSVRHGQKWVAKGFVLQAMPRKEEMPGDMPRFGFVVAGKALKENRAGEPAKRPGAVLRNRARRRLKEAVRLLAAHSAKPNYDYVVIGRREALHQSFADLLEDLRFAFEKVNRPPRARDGNAAPKRDGKASAGDSQRRTEKL